jgi:proteasome accessory factor C
MTGDTSRAGPRPEVLGAGERLRRLLAVLAHLARVGEESIDELAGRFAMDPSALVGELELAACCGLPPYTPDQLLELVVDDHSVVAHGLQALRRPPRLTPDEGFAVAAAARALLAVPGSDASGPLASALAKLEAALGHDRIDVEIDAPAHLDALRDAAAASRVVEIDYLGSRPGGESTRLVEPHRVVALDGRFYCDAYCRLAGGWRRFQVERIDAVRPAGTTFERRDLPDELDGAHAFAGGDSATIVLLQMAEGRRALVDRLAAGPIELAGDGRIVVPVRIADEHFLGRLLLRLGPDAEVVDPPGLSRARAVVAESALRRYERRGGVSGQPGTRVAR